MSKYGPDPLNSHYPPGVSGSDIDESYKSEKIEKIMEEEDVDVEEALKIYKKREKNND